MSGQHHIINRQGIHITCSPEADAAYLLDEVSRINKSKLIPLLSQLLDELIPADQQLRIDTLQIDLGEIRASHLERDLTEALYKQLPTGLQKQLQAQASDQAGAEPVDKAQAKQSLVQDYLESGQLPWWARRSSQPDMPQLLQSQLEQSPEQTITLIKNYGRQAAVRQRLAWQFPESTLQLIIRLLEQGHYAVVIAYIKELSQLQEDQQLVTAGATPFRQALYEFVLTYLLVERGSRFNTKSFVASTLRQMASRYQLSYAQLLNLFAQAMESIRPGTPAWRDTLPGLIDELLDETLAGSADKQSGLLAQSPKPGQAFGSTGHNSIGRQGSTEKINGERLLEILSHYLQHGSISWRDQALVRELPEVLLQQALLLMPAKATGLIKALLPKQASLLQLLADNYSPFTLKKLLAAALPAAELEQLLSWQAALHEALQTHPLWVGSSQAQERLLWHIGLVAAFNKASLPHTAPSFTHQLWSLLLAYSGIDLATWSAWAAQQTKLHLPGKLAVSFFTDQKQMVTPMALWEAWQSGLSDYKLLNYGYEEPEDLLAHLLVHERSALRSWSKQAWAHARGLARRSSRAFNNTQLTALIELHQPAQYGQIGLYAKKLQAQQHKDPLSHQSTDAFRQLSWEIILTVLWSDRGSAFNLQAFVKRTLQQLAASLLTSYDVLLERFTLHGALFAENEQGNALYSVLQALLHENQDTTIPANWQLSGLTEAQQQADPHFRADRLYHQLEQSPAPGANSLPEHRLQQITTDLEYLLAYPAALQEVIGHYLQAHTGTTPLQQVPTSVLAQIIDQKAAAKSNFIHSFQEELLAILSAALPPDKRSKLSLSWLQSLSLRFLYQLGSAPFGESRYMDYITQELIQNLRLSPIRMADYLAQLPEEKQEHLQERISTLRGDAGDKRSSLSPKEAFVQASEEQKTVELYLQYWLPRNPERVQEVLKLYMQLSGHEAEWWVAQLSSSSQQALSRYLYSSTLPTVWKLYQELRLLLGTMRFTRLAAHQLDALLLEHLISFLSKTGSPQKPAAYFYDLIGFLARKEATGEGGIRFLARTASRELGDKLSTQLKALLSTGATASEPATKSPASNTTAPQARQGQEGSGQLDYYQEQSEKQVIGEPIYVHNAGLVLAWSFLPTLFKRLEYTTPLNKFKDEQLAYRAVHLSEYLATGLEGQPEYRLVLNKLLCGIEQAKPITQGLELSQQEKDTADSLITHGIMGNWSVLKGTTAEGLKETFMTREGKLTETEDSWQLQVEKQSYDMLLDYIQWKINLVKLTWMSKPIYVQWR